MTAVLAKSGHLENAVEQAKVLVVVEAEVVFECVADCPVTQGESLQKLTLTFGLELCWVEATETYNNQVDLF